MVEIILPRAQGTPGVTPIFTIGTVTTGTPAVTQTGTPQNPVLNFVFPPGAIGAGDVVGPASSVTGNIPAYADTTGKLLDGGRAVGVASSTDLLDRASGDARYQPLDADLTAIAALSTTAFGRGALVFADAAAARSAYGVVIGTNVQAWDADLDALAALSGTNTIYYRSGAATWSAVTIGANLTFSGGTLSATGGAGSGDVTGPASATDNGVALYNGTTGKIIKDGPAISTLATLASPAFTGTPTAPTAAPGTNTTQIATTAYADAIAALKANLASPTFTGTPAAPTAAAGTNTTQIATTAFVTTAVADEKPIQAFGIACSDETTAITTGNAKATFRMPYAFTLTAVRASLTTASSSGLPTIDINENGVSILSTKITIDVSERTSTTAATPPVISDSSLADDAEITIDIDVAGTGAAGLKVYLIGRRT